MVIRRAGAPDIRFEPATALTQARRLNPALIFQLIPGDGEPYGFKDEHARKIANVVRLLCGASSAPTEAQETAGIVGTFLSDAIAVEGFTTYGNTAQRFEAIDNLRPQVDPQTGRVIGLPRYLIDSATGELVIRVSDLQAAARRHTGASVAHGWLDARMQNLGWERLELQGYETTGRVGRRGPHLRCGVYRGVLPMDEAEDEGPSEHVNTGEPSYTRARENDPLEAPSDPSVFACSRVHAPVSGVEQ